ncbi:DUF4873 domain-containing protein [Calidifontibacter sp. DB0510]|uniref:DUF4873 domain-containing protein n=1 Tax=Metallococcus carri TaxID=1656884 RepID=A0A967B4K3_9MICO|nr:DUF4873 domain-containing protein [Metallococcus carri]NHN54506.1 DUF4873 domain-containing protein [Metallococcus carri]NOP36655.1 DUF4873 domain-containing protein [Calidifontibacter sp. DB2511S]
MNDAPEQLTDEGYDGPVTLTVEGREVTADASLRGAFMPIDGRFHWYGRLDSVASQSLSSGATVTITTPRGSAEGRLSDTDMWDRLRITGFGRPPF